MADKIDGKAFAATLRGKIKTHVAELVKDHNLTPGLAVVLVGEDPASQVYVRNKGKQTLEAGMKSIEHRLDTTTSEAELLALIDQLNHDPAIHGILVQLPLPAAIDSAKVLAAINPDKDVDGFHVVNVGRLSVQDQRALVPCTPQGCLMLLQDHLGTAGLKGANAVIVGRSNIVGKPMAQLLLGADCTVTIAHSRSQNLPEICKAADIVVAAVGRAEMVKGDWIKSGATVIDVGINRIDYVNDAGETKQRLVGDVAFDEMDHAGAITPVPGGVGPMTIACLLRNTLLAACNQNGIDHSRF